MITEDAFDPLPVPPPVVESVTLMCGSVQVCAEASLLRQGTQSVRLTEKEFKLFSLFLSNRGVTQSKDMILDHLYGGGEEPESKIIDVFICKLRKKISAVSGGPHYIETVWGRGYVLRE